MTNKKKAASVESLNELHELVTKTLITSLKEDPTSAMLSVARQFLKDSNIEATQDNEDMQSLKDSLPSFDDEEPDDEFSVPPAVRKPMPKQKIG